MRRIAILLAMIIVISTASVPAFGYTVSHHGGFDDIAFVCSSGLYRIGSSGSTFHLERIAPDPFRDEVSLPYPIASASICGGRAVALCDSVEDEQLVVCSYEIGTGIIESYYIPYAAYGYHRGFYLDSHGILIQDDDRPSVIRQLSLNGKLIDSYDFQGSDVTFIYGYSSGLYILCDGRLFYFTGSDYQPIGGDMLRSPAAFITDNVIADRSGTLYRISTGQCQTIIESGIHNAYPAAAVMSSSYYIADGGTVYRCDASGRRTDYFSADDPIMSLYCSGGILYAVTDASTVMSISPEEFLPCPDNAPTPPASSPITSGTYRVDSVNYRITRIPSVTTFAQFKSNTSCIGYETQLIRDGKIIKSGNVGTAMTVVFSGIDTYTYELSVIGDITGEGNVNSRDVSELMDYFLGNITFDGVYLDAADLSDDGRVDPLDLAMLCRTVQ